MPNEDFYTSMLDLEECEICKYYGTDEEVVIPSCVDGLFVTEIAKEAFFGNKSIKKVVIPDSVFIIRYCAFRGCTSLKEVYLTDTINIIESEAFGYVDNVKIHFPDKPIDIAPNALTKKAYRLNRTIKGNGEYLGSILWKVRNKKIKKFVVPKECKYIEADVFYDCGNLETIEFEDGCDAYFNWFSDEPLYYHIGNLKEIKTGDHFNRKLGLQILEYAIEYDKPTMVLEKFTNVIHQRVFDSLIKESREKNRVGILSILIELYHRRFGGFKNNNFEI